MIPICLTAWSATHPLQEGFPCFTNICIKNLWDFFLHYPYFLIWDIWCKAETVNSFATHSFPSSAPCKHRNVSWASVAVGKKDRSPSAFPSPGWAKPTLAAVADPPDHWFSFSKHHHRPVASWSLAWSVCRRYKFLLWIAAGILAYYYDGDINARCCPNTRSSIGQWNCKWRQTSNGLVTMEK